MVFSYFHFYFFMIDVFLMTFLTIKVCCLGLFHLRVGFFGSYEENAKYFVNKNMGNLV